MSTLSRHQPAGSPGRAAAPAPRTLLVAFTLLALSLSGCSSLRLGNGCGPCSGGGGGGPFKKLGQRIFRKHAAPAATPYYTDACEPGFIDGGISGVPVEMGGAPVITSPPATIQGATPAAPGEVDSAPLELNPIQGSTSNRPAAKSLYEAQTSTGSLASTPSRGSDQVALTQNRSEGVAVTGALGTVDPLSKFEPKLSPPTQLEQVPSGLPVEAEALPKTSSQVLRPPAPPASDATPPASVPVPATAPSTDDTVAGLAPGFRSFKSVEPRLAGGSLPSSGGFGWLNEQGFRTVIDLRPAAEVQQDEIAQIQSKGLKYVAIPIEAGSLADPKTLDRFATEIQQESSRPIYFFDADGSRAAALWYAYRVSRDGISPSVAEREADEIGPRDPKFWTEAGDLIKAAKPAPASTAPVVPQPPDAPVPDR